MNRQSQRTAPKRHQWAGAACILAGVLSTLLALIVLVGWYMHYATLVQVHPAFAPMQYNTALAFLFCGAGLLSVKFHRRYMPTVCGFVVAAVGVVTLIEYIFGAELGIDQLVMEHYITVETSDPGRMAPNTALCFGLSGLALLAARTPTRLRKRTHVLALFGVIIASLGTVALFGYLSAVETAYGWGNLTRMAVHTAAGFALVGTGLFALAWRESGDQETGAPQWLPISAFLLGATLAVSLWRALRTSDAIATPNSLMPALVLVAGVASSFLLAASTYSQQRAIRRALEIVDAEKRIRRQNAVVDAINNVLRVALTCETKEELGKTCLAVAEELTSSEFGFLGELNPAGLMDTIAISDPGWDACTMGVSDARRFTEAMPVRGIDRATMRDGKSRIVNADDMATHPDRVGAPDGHPEVTAFLGVPLKHEGKTIGMIGLGNKEGGYDTADQDAVEHLAVAIVEALQRTRVEQRLRLHDAALEAAANAIAITDRDGKVIWANPAFSRLTGYAGEEVIGRNPRFLKSGQHDDAFYRNMWETILSGRVWQGEVRNRRKDGSIFDDFQTITPVQGRQGQITHFIAVNEDITERKHGEAEAARHTAEVQLLHTVTTMTIEATSFEAALEQCMNMVCEAVGWPVGHFYLAGNDGTGELMPSTAWHLSDAQRFEVFRTAIERAWFKPGNGVPGRILQSGEPVWIPDVQADDDFPCVRECVDIGMKSAFGFPVKLGGRIVAVLEFFSSEAMQQDDRLFLWACSVGEQLGRVLERKQGEAKFGGLVDAAPDALIIVNERGIITLVNAQTEKLFGYPRSELVGMAVEALIPERFVERHPEHRANYLANPTPRSMGGDVDLYAQRMDGTEFPVEIALSPLASSGERHVCAAVRDITERKRAEMALRHSEERFRQLAENIDQVFWLNDLSTDHLDYVSPAYEVIWGRTRANVYGHPRLFVETVLTEDRPRAMATVTKPYGGKSFDLEYRIMRPDGSIRWIRDRSFAIANEQGEVYRFVGIAEDITERKHAEMVLDEAHKQLVQASRQAGMAEVASNILHNIGNVLNSVNISVSLLGEKASGSMVGELCKVVELIRDHADDLGTFVTKDEQGRKLPGYLMLLADHLAGEHANLIRELESVGGNVEHIKEIIATQQSHAKACGLYEPVSVVESMDHALQINATSLKRHEIEVVREYAEVPPVFGERHKLLPVFVNLVANAKSALADVDRRARRLEVRIAGDGNDRVRIEVNDNGSGIEEDNLTRIFAHGFTTKKDGHGFGLHSSALAVQQVGGSLTARSDGPGTGASFVVDLPVRHEEALT